jgi:uncharacterized membrane protein
VAVMPKARAGSYPAQGLHPVVGYLVGWGYAMITGLVGPIVNLLIGYFVGTILNTEFGWNFKAMWITFMLVSAAVTALLGYRGVKLGTRFGVALGAFEIIVFVALSIWMIVKAGSSAQTLSVFTLKVRDNQGLHRGVRSGRRLGLRHAGFHRVRGCRAARRGGAGAATDRAESRNRDRACWSASICSPRTRRTSTRDMDKVLD